MYKLVENEFAKKGVDIITNAMAWTREVKRQV